MSKHFIYPALLCLALIPLTGGCAMTDSRRTSHSSWQSSSWEADVLRQTNKLRSMNTAELANEAETLQKAFVNRRSEENRLRLALFHAVSPQGDRSRALNLFDVAPSEANGRGRNHPLAQIFLPLLQEYRRVDEGFAANQLKLREEQKRNEALQQSNEQMRQKLDAIREIEVKILERPASK